MKDAHKGVEVTRRNKLKLVKTSGVPRDGKNWPTEGGGRLTLSTAYCEDCLVTLRKFDDTRIDQIVTDPVYSFRPGEVACESIARSGQVNLKLKNTMKLATTENTSEYCDLIQRRFDVAKAKAKRWPPKGIWLKAA